MFVFAPPPPCWKRKPDALRAQLFIPWPCGGNALVSQTLERFVCVCVCAGDQIKTLALLLLLLCGAKFRRPPPTFGWSGRNVFSPCVYGACECVCVILYS